MKTATLRELRNNFSMLESWLAEGETIEICRRGKPVAVLTVPSTRSAAEPPPLPDFAGRRREVWGNRVFSDDELARMEAYEMDGQEG